MAKINHGPIMTSLWDRYTKRKLTFMPYRQMKAQKLFEKLNALPHSVPDYSYKFKIVWEK